MAKDLNDLNPKELGQLFPIELSPKKYPWKKLFEKEMKELQKILGKDIATRIVHFGSTAIPNIETKATVDILLEIPKSKTTRQTVIHKMTANGYNHMHNHPTHMMFVKGYTPTGVEEISYHIHMGSSDEDQLWDRIYFRDYLIENPHIVAKYSNLKKMLAIKHKYDREAYTEAKNSFVKKYTEIAKESTGTS